MVRQYLGAGVAALLIVSDRLAVVALAIAAIAMVRIIEHANRPPPAPKVIVHIS
jgi:hypothetical protein